MKAMRNGLVMLALLLALAAAGWAQEATGGQALVWQSQYLGRLSTSPYLADSTANPYGVYGSQYSPRSIRNPYGLYGSRYSTKSATNPYALSAPKLFSADGRYLGKLSANRYDPESVSNPHGIYGSKYSPLSINNPYGLYGSPYSPLSAKNPYATAPPLIVGDE